MKLLRVLQSGEFERLGSNSTRKVDVRLVSATNADLGRAIAEGTFREDLLFRLNVIELHLPALNERTEDILPLAEHFLVRLAGQGQTPCTLSDEAAQALLAYDFPGNVRELQNKLQRASLVCRDGRISLADLALSPQRTATPRRDVSSERAPAIMGEKPAQTASPPAISSADNAERAQIEEALTRAGGVVAKAAAELGLSRQALYRRMERLGLSMERRVRD
jgi:DNA-binding NtrC family response regulator